MDVIFCRPCDRHFNDRDNTGVCPQGHETRVPDDDEYPIGQVTI